MRKIFLIIFLFFSLFFASLHIQAACPTGGLVPCGTSDCPCQFCHFFTLFKNVIDFILLKIVPPLAALMVAIGGFMYIFAYLGGGPTALSQANKVFMSVAWGLLIIFCAWLVVNTFFTVIGVEDWTGLSSGWWKVNCPTQ